MTCAPRAARGTLVRMTRTLAVLALSSIALPSLARAETLYVDHMVPASCTTYDVATRACGDGTSRAYPRVQDTFDVVAPGDIVEIREGVYDEEDAYGPSPASGTAGSPITFRGYMDEAVHLLGDVDPHVSSGVGSPFRLLDVDHVTIERMEISGFFQGVVVGGSDSVRSGPADFITLRDLHIHDCGLGIYVRAGSSNLVVTDVLAVANFLVGDGGAGLAIRDGTDIRVERMIARDNDDGRGIDGDGDGFHIEPGVRVALIDCVAENNSEDGYDLTGDEIRIERSIADRSGAVGFKLWDEHSDGDVPGVNHYVLVHALATRSGEAGIFAANGPHVALYGSVVYGNTGEGIRLTRGLDTYPDPDPPVAIMIDDILAENGRWGRRFGDGGGADDEGWSFTSHHNLFFANEGDEVYPGEGTGTLYVDPMFVDGSAGDFHLRAGSPAIDTGADLSAEVTVDFDGIARPQGAGWDIGAFEHLVPGADAGLAAIDAGGGDAAISALDAGPRADGGASATPGGCGCRTGRGTSSAGPVSVLMLALGALARRRPLHKSA
jgi:MYXO-CTERM domain-containing protein